MLFVFPLVSILLGCSVGRSSIDYPQHLTFSNIRWKSDTFSPQSRFIKRNEKRNCKLGEFNEKKSYFEATFDGVFKRIYSMEEFSPEYIISHPQLFLSMIRKRQNEIIQTESFAARDFIFEERLVYDEVYGKRANVCKNEVKKVSSKESVSISTKELQCITMPFMQEPNRIQVPLVGEGYFFKKEMKTGKDDYTLTFYRIILWLMPSNDSDAVKQCPVKVGDVWFHFPSISVLAVCIQEAN